MSIRSLFGNRKGSKSQSQYKRTLRIESLEERTLLSAAPLSTSEYADLRAQYAEFNLPANMANLNVITLDLAQGDGLSQLRSAITQAGQTTKSDLIVVRTSNSANTINFTAAGNELTININASQYGSVTIVGFGSNAFTLNANQKCRGMTISGSSSVNLGGLTIANGKGDISGISAGAEFTAGGGIYISSGSVIIGNCTISGNSANFGGGIYTAKNTTLKINNCDIKNNTTTYFLDDYNYRSGSQGGGIANNGALTITNSMISGNTADTGGGVHNFDGTLTVSNSSISQNTSRYVDGDGYTQGSGGGISNFGNATLTNCTIAGNIAGSEAGGIFHSNGTLTITNCLINGNSAQSGGGFIVNSSSDTITITNSTISNNTATLGGGFAGGGKLTVNSSFITDNTATIGAGGCNGVDAVLIMTNSVISHNKSSSYGGGVVSYGSATIYNCTIAGNTATTAGGGLHFNSKPVSVYNTIIVGNTATNNSDIYKETANLTVTGYNNLSSFTGWSGSGNIAYNGNPQFVNAANGDYRLLPNSQAIDKGSNTFANNAGLTSNSSDLSGVPRFDGTIDIGAYEHQKNVMYSNVVTTLEDSYDPNDNEWSLREAISYAPVYYSTGYPTITFAENLNGTITLTRGQLEITSPLSIYGDNRVIIDGNQKNRVFKVNAGTASNPVVLNGLTIQNGYADYAGGGIYNLGALRITNSTITRNTAAHDGGGIDNHYSSSSLTIENCAISSNTAMYGGGIHNYYGALTITDSEILKNSGSEYGGGIFNYGNLVVASSTISENRAEHDGGGINNNTGSITLTNSLITNNSASNYGGGIHNHYGTISITNSTISRNAASMNGGGINAYYGTYSADNTILADNAVNDIFVLESGSVSGSNNLSSYTGWSSGSDNLIYDFNKPLFVDAENDDYHLIKGSQAIDKGGNARAVDANGQAIVNDLDNRARIVNGTVDIGAYEFLNPEITVNGKKVTVVWLDDSPAADAVRYRAVGATTWKTVKLRAGVTMYSFNGAVGTSYEIEVLLDQQENNVLQGSAVVLDQPKLSSIKNELKDDAFQVNVTNYYAKNLVTNATQAIVTVNGVQTAFDIVNQQGSKNLSGGGKVLFANGLFTFTEMASNTSYKVQVAFSDGNCVSTASSALTVKTLKAPYLAPAITSATAVSDTSITVTWETAYGKKSNAAAQKYTVQYSTDGVKWSNATTGATGNSYTIQKLKGGVEYTVRVLATKDNAFNASEPSSVLTAETLARPKMALEKNSVKDDSFQLNVTNYQNTNLTKATTINVKSDKFGTAAINLINGTGSGSFANGMTVEFNNGAMTFANVPNATQQKIQVNFKEGVCTTAWSNALTVKTLVAPYNKPVLTNAVAVSSTSIEVDWNTVYGKNSTTAAQKYTVQYSTDGVKWTNATTSATGTHFTISRLKPNTKYLVAVIANKDSYFNASQPSDSLLVTTFN